jgi:hypothetical protein
VAALYKGGNSGPAIVPHQSDASRLIQAVSGSGDAKPMPPQGPRLSAGQIRLLRLWIDQGAHAPADERLSAEAKPSKHWAFQPPLRRPLPVVRDGAWLRNPIDSFVLARLEKDGVASSPEADRSTLIRRVTLDLVGLPPSIPEIEAFLADQRPGAYERVVDRLLASPHYGERWGRHWLDAARYADSNGYSIDAPRSIWKYRDWVIDALNHDLPFDQFTIEQIAGDLLPDATPEQQIATGFHRNTPINEEGGIDLEQFRIESIVDRVNTTGAVFLGLTLGCAQCHDHKFDPISQREYYQFFAFFNNADEPALDVPTPEQVRQRQRLNAQIAALKQKLRLLDYTSETKQTAWEKSLSHEAEARLPASIRAIIFIPVYQRTAQQKRTLSEAYRSGDRARDVVGGLANPLPFAAAWHAAAAVQRFALDKEIEKLQHRFPKVVTTLVVHERAQPRRTNIHLGGDFLRKGAEVSPAVPAVLNPLPAGKPNRLDLARWLVDRRNPLTSRVMVNRFWQHYFGIGLVETENDFGTQGTLPSHPELLDWLATEFMGRQWSMKALHRLIVTSATYRQSSRARPELATLDPRNRLLARQSRVRLDAEIVRDVALASSGLLSQHIGGPGVFPPQPDGVYAFTQIVREWKENAGAERYRRGMYTTFWRSAPHPELMVFDAPNAVATCTRRIRSNTPLQALTLLNDRGFFELAEALARRVLREAGSSATERLQYAFRICLGRSPRRYEMARLGNLLTEQRGESGDGKELGAWTAVARVLLNLDEFITRE